MGSHRTTVLRRTPTVPMSRFKIEYGRSVNWQSGPTSERAYVGPGVVIPPRKEDCSCACSATDEYNRPVHIGLCPDPDCERRPR